MPRKILMAVDGSKNSSEAIAEVGQLFKEQTDCHVVLLHCAQRSLSVYPKEIRSKVDYPREMPAVVQEELAEKILEEGKRILVDNGFSTERVHLKMKLNGVNPAEVILKEAEKERIQTIVLGRRYLTPMQRLAFGGVSTKIVQAVRNRTVWVIDPPVAQTRKVLVAVDGAQECRVLTYYMTEMIASIPDLRFKLLHLLPQLPPTYWDDGHILNAEEQKGRQAWKDEWRSEYLQKVQKYLSEARHYLIDRGVPPDSVETQVIPARYGITSNLLTEIARNRYQMVIIGKRSFRKEKMFHFGSHANKVLYKVKKTILCAVD
jgi:nucleotide-binding universal stress UspA family protein